MSDGSTYGKRRAATRRSLQSIWRLVAHFVYRIGEAGANPDLPLPFVALDVARPGETLLWGGPVQ